MRFWLPFLLLGLSLTTTLRAQEDRPGGTPLDSLEANRLQIQLEDSLTTGIALFEGLVQRQNANSTDSLRLAVQRGLGPAWMEWALNAPRPSMSGDDWIRLGKLYGMLDIFSMPGTYDRQLNCYRYAIQYEKTKRKATLLLHSEYHRAGFAPGMLQTGTALLELDRDAALRDGVAKSMALANYFLGDRKAAKKWIKLHRKAQPKDPEGAELQQRIKEMPRHPRFKD